MILGLGIDLVEVARIEQSISKFGDAFLLRILRTEEMEYVLRHRAPAQYVAVRLAAKEAVSKAFGTGIGAELGWQDIEITRSENGQPGIRLHGNGANLLRSRGVEVIHVSLTHSDAYASAVVILERLDLQRPALV